MLPVMKAMWVLRNAFYRSLLADLFLGMGLKSIVKRPMRAFSGVTLGGALIYRGVTGYCPVKESIEPKEPEATVIEHRYFVK